MGEEYQAKVTASAWDLRLQSVPHYVPGTGKKPVFSGSERDQETGKRWGLK